MKRSYLIEIDDEGVSRMNVRDARKEFGKWTPVIVTRFKKDVFLMTQLKDLIEVDRAILQGLGLI